MELKGWDAGGAILKERNPSAIMYVSKKYPFPGVVQKEPPQPSRTDGASKLTRAPPCAPLRTRALGKGEALSRGHACWRSQLALPAARPCRADGPRSGPQQRESLRKLRSAGQAREEGAGARGSVHPQPVRWRRSGAGGQGAACGHSLLPVSQAAAESGPGLPVPSLWSPWGPVAGLPL